MHGCHVWTGFCLHSCLVGKNAYGCPRHNLGKCKLSLRHRFWARLIAKLGFPREHSRKNNHSKPLLEDNSPPTRAGLSPSLQCLLPSHSLPNVPCSSVHGRSHNHDNTHTDPASQACWDGECEDTGAWKASQSLKNKQTNKKYQSCIYMINQNPLLGFIANSQVPRTWSLVQGWPLPVF